MFKWRFIRNFRVDSHYILKILIIFNILLGIYLLFLSTNYRRYSYEYPHNLAKNNDNKIVQKFHQSNIVDNVIIIKNNTNNQIINDHPQLPKPSLKKQANSNNNDNALNDDKNSQIVDKVFDSNNHPVKLQEIISNNNNNNNIDSSYKRVEEDEKIIIDENDKLKIEMLGAKPDEQNSIIHMDLDSFIIDNINNKDSNDVVDVKENDNNKSKNHKDNVKEINDDILNKDVIKQIMDHNSHIKKNFTQKIIIPDNVNLEQSLTSSSVTWTSEIRGKYNVLKNYIIGLNDNLFNYNRTITLTTQGDPNFLYHSEELCSRWDGPISLAVYAPGNDFISAINIIYYLRQCRNECIAKNIFWHLIYDNKYPPSAKINSPNHYLKTNSFNCNKTLDETIKLFKLDSNFRTNNSLPYPINVLRNVARSSSKTKYLLASDIELYPNVGIISSFFDMIDREKKGLIPIINSKLPHVYVLPIFEVKADKQPPRTKQELSNLFKSKDAIFFHRYVCDKCQNFPDRNIWINEIPKINTMNIFRVTKRTHDRNQWEPLYIGTNDEPFYDERLTWDGKRDKMSQMYEMCLMNYDLLILDNAFLVHAPGIKHYHPKDDEKRLKYIKYNHQIYTSVLSQLRKKYGNKNHC